jgi:hypothetical protein
MNFPRNYGNCLRDIHDIHRVLCRHEGYINDNKAVRKIGSQSNKIKTNVEIKHRRYTIQ